MATRYPIPTSQLVAMVESQSQTDTPWTTTYGLLTTVGYTSQQEVAAQLRSAGWSQQRISQTFGYRPSFLTRLFGGLKQAVVIGPTGVGDLAPAAGAGAAGAEAGAAGAAGGSAASTALKVGAGLAAAEAITGPADFLKLLAWLFHPLNWLRAVEFILGVVLVILGLRASSRSLQGRPSAPVLTSLPRPRLPGSGRRRAERQGRRQAQRGEARSRERERLRESN